MEKSNLKNNKLDIWNILSYITGIISAISPLIAYINFYIFIVIFTVSLIMFHYIVIYLTVFHNRNKNSNKINSPSLIIFLLIVFIADMAIAGTFVPTIFIQIKFYPTFSFYYILYLFKGAILLIFIYGYLAYIFFKDIKLDISSETNILFLLCTKLYMIYLV